MSEPPEERPELAYWKIAIAELPTGEMRDAAWEFLLRHLAQNPKMADTFSAMIMVMQASGLYMLTMPNILHKETIIPLRAELNRFLEESEQDLKCQQEIASEMLEGAQAAQAGAQAAERSVKELENTIRTGWKEVNTRELAEKIKVELESIVFRPFRARCQELETLTALAQEASQKVEQSIEKFRGIHFGGILGTMALACLLVMGSLFGYGWKKLSDHYHQNLAKAIEEVQQAGKRFPR